MFKRNVFKVNPVLPICCAVALLAILVPAGESHAGISISGGGGNSSFRFRISGGASSYRSVNTYYYGGCAPYYSLPYRRYGTFYPTYSYYAYPYRIYDNHIYATRYSTYGYNYSVRNEARNDGVAALTQDDEVDNARISAFAERMAAKQERSQQIHDAWEALAEHDGDAAYAEFSDALKGRDEAEVRLGLALATALRGDMTQAAAEARRAVADDVKALDAAPRDVDLTASLERITARYEAALALDDANHSAADTLFMLGVLHHLRGDATAAAAAVAPLLSDDARPSPATRRLSARIAWEQRRDERIASRTTEKPTENDSKVPEAAEKE